MDLALDPTIAAYLQANNERNPAAQLACFSPHAVVIDEGKTHRGPAEIGRWLAETSAAYAVNLEAMGVDSEEDEAVVTCRVSGTFPGSPIQLRFFFTLLDGKIAALTIRQ